MSHLLCPNAPACKGPCKKRWAVSNLAIAQAANRAYLSGGVRAEQTHDYARVLDKVWEGDKSLLRRYHALAPCSLKKAVADSVAVLTDCTGPNFVFCELLHQRITVGFFGIDMATNDLITFGLRPDFRGLEYKAALWDWIRTFGDASRPMHVALHAHNARARRFIQAGGGHLTHTIQDGARIGVLYELNF